MRASAALLGLLLATPAAGQVQSFGLDGSLEPTREIGCIPLEQVEPEFTAADLTYGALACLRARDFDTSVTLFIAMQVFGVFDAQRVNDTSAHQAVAVLGQHIALSIPAEDQSAYQDAVTRFGGVGSGAHEDACAAFRRIGPPDYHPTYMIRHGQMAFLRPDEPPIVDGFSPEASWAAVLVNFLNCPARADE